VNKDDPVPWHAFNLSAILFASIVGALCVWGITMNSSLARLAAVQEAQAASLSRLIDWQIELTTVAKNQYK
jgi:uncharacterized membrane protein SpoIIM required for sporulation